MAVYKLRQLLFAEETSFAENAGDSASTPSWSDNAPIIDAQVELMQERVPDGAMQSRLAERFIGHRSVRRAKLTFTQYWQGNLTTAASSVTTTSPQASFLIRGLGGSATTSGTTAGTGSTANVVNVASASGMAVGEIIRVGTKNDGGGDGQAAVIASISGTALTLLTNLPAAPSNAHVVYATGMAHHDEAGTSAKTLRFLVMHDTTNAQFALFGCDLAGIRFTIPLGPSGLPTIQFTYECAYWRTIATSFPNSTALANHFCAPVAGGSMFINDVATATRATINPAEIELNVNLGLSPVYGATQAADAGQFQVITDFTRTMMNVDLLVKIPWVNTYQTWFDSEDSTITNKHILFTANPADGRSVGFYMPNVQPGGNRPSYVTPVSDQNYVLVHFEGREGTTTTNELTRSAIRLFWG